MIRSLKDRFESSDVKVDGDTVAANLNMPGRHVDTSIRLARCTRRRIGTDPCSARVHFWLKRHLAQLQLHRQLSFALPVSMKRWMTSPQ